MKANRLIKVHKLLYVLIILCAFFACNHSPSLDEEIPISSVDVNETHKAISSEVGNTTTTVSPNTTHLKIIKSAQTRYKVKNLKTATAKIKALATSFGAYISDMRFENNTYHKENRLTLKVPSQYFDAVFDSLPTFADFVDYENITTKDVTEEYIDVETRLATKQEVKDRYESILIKNAITVEDILATEEKLSKIQEEIEVSQGRLKYLTNKVAFSTIQIDLYEAVTYTEKPESYTKSFWNKSKEGLLFGWHIVEALFLGLIHIWPIIILGALLLLYFKNRKK